MFRGSSYHTIDPKGRVIIPVRFRQILNEKGGDGLMISRLDGALVAYPYDQWFKIEKRILSLVETSDTIRLFKRTFIGGSSDCLWDKQGRILIPPELRNYAKLEKDIVLVGVMDHFEILTREKWDQENARLEETVMRKEEARNEIAKLGL